MANLSDFFKNESDGKKTILFIDLHSLLHRCLHSVHSKATKEMLTLDEMWVYFRYLVTNNIINSVKTYSANRVIIACDNKFNWRKSIYPEYKANRKLIRDVSAVDYKQFVTEHTELTEDLKKVFTNFHFLDIDYVEADDIIGVLATSTDYKEAIVITTDSDYVQLLKHKHIKLFHPIKKKFIKVLNPKTELLCKIIIGDKSDNIKQLKSGVGIKTAVKIINEGIESFIESDKVIKENYILNTKLIDWDYIPVEYVNKIKHTYDNYELKPLNSKNLLLFFAKLKVDSLTKNYTSFSSFLSKVA